MTTLFGVNVPYLDGDYGHDLADNARYPTWPCEFSAMRAYRPLVEARRLGLSAVRVWLCENGEGLRVDADGAIVGVSDRLLESIAVLQEAAAVNGLYLYFCFLDGNAWAREGDGITRSILADEDQAERFAERVVRPVARALDSKLHLALEVINEPESSAAECIDDPAIEAVPWEGIGRAIRLAGDAARAEREILVTSGTMHAFLPRLLEVDARLDAIDVHVYHPNGGLPSRDDLASYVGDDALRSPALPIFGGELGIPKDPGPERPDSLCHYLYNAERLGYAAAFLWQLEGDLVDKTDPKRAWTWLGGRVHEEVIALGKRSRS